MDKRNRLWRKSQMMRHWKRRLQEFTAYSDFRIRLDDGTLVEPPHWWEVAQTKWAKIYKTTGTPCSCWMCKNYSYDRKAFKKETKRIIQESTTD